MESVFSNGKYSEIATSVKTHSGVATHLCTGTCGCAKTLAGTYPSNLNGEVLCVTDPLDSRFADAPAAVSA